MGFYLVSLYIWPHISLVNPRFGSMCTQNPGVFSRVGDRFTNQPQRGLNLGWLHFTRWSVGAIPQPSRLLQIPGSESCHSQRGAGCQEILSKQQQKALSRFFLIMLLSKYLIIVENKLHVAEIILWGPLICWAFEFLSRCCSLWNKNCCHLDPLL